MSEMLRFDGGTERDPAIDAWFRQQHVELSSIGRPWFVQMRECGDDVCELLHDGHPTACIGDAAFGYVNVFKAHVNVGFFHGAEIADPEGLLDGTGKFMRHVKVHPGRPPVVDAQALLELIQAAYLDMQKRLESG